MQGKLPVICNMCGDLFMATRSTRKFCGAACRVEHLRRSKRVNTLMLQCEEKMWHIKELALDEQNLVDESIKALIVIEKAARNERAQLERAIKEDYFSEQIETT